MRIYTQYFLQKNKAFGGAVSQELGAVSQELGAVVFCFE
jgi:hypothetical protein